MLRQSRHKMQGLAGDGMLQVQGPRVQVQLFADRATELSTPAVAQIVLTGAAIFAIPDNGVADLSHVDAQLVCAPGNR